MIAVAAVLPEGPLYRKDVTNVWIGEKVEVLVVMIAGKVSKLLVLLVEIDVAEGRFCRSPSLAVLVRFTKPAVTPRGSCIDWPKAMISLIIDRSYA